MGKFRALVSKGVPTRTQDGPTLGRRLPPADQVTKRARGLTPAEFQELRATWKALNDGNSWGQYKLDIAHGVLLDTPANDWAFERLEYLDGIAVMKQEVARMRPAPAAR